MKNRVKVGEVEVGFMQNPLPNKTNWIVYRYRARTNEYLSKQDAYTMTKAENLFRRVIGQEELRQKRALEQVVADLARGSIATEVAPARERIAQAGEAFYRDHPYYSRF